MLDEIPTTSCLPKPEKKIPTGHDLYVSDIFSMGSIIGQLTNKGATALALLDNFKKKYGEDSEQYKLTKNRIIQVCKAQGLQIDKSKLGREVKGIPTVWTKKIPYSPDLTDEQDKERKAHNELLLNRRPYFFTHLYSDSRRDFKEYNDKQETQCRIEFNCSLTDILNKPNKNDREKEFCDYYYERSPVIISDSVMNKICYHVENFKIDIKKQVNKKTLSFDYNIYKDSDIEYEPKEKKVIIKAYKEYKESKKKENYFIKKDDDEKLEYSLYDHILKVCSNPQVSTSVLVDYLYKDNPKSSKSELWNNFGKEIFLNVLKHNDGKPIYFPLRDKNGNIEYLGNKYSRKEVGALWN